jgi:hypothetical protein
VLRKEEQCLAQAGLANRFGCSHKALGIIVTCLARVREYRWDIPFHSHPMPVAAGPSIIVSDCVAVPWVNAVHRQNYTHPHAPPNTNGQKQQQKHLQAGREHVFGVFVSNHP